MDLQPANKFKAKIESEEIKNKPPINPNLKL